MKNYDVIFSTMTKVATGKVAASGTEYLGIGTSAVLPGLIGQSIMQNAVMQGRSPALGGTIASIGALGNLIGFLSAYGSKYKEPKNRGNLLAKLFVPGYAARRLAQRIRYTADRPYEKRR